MAWNDQGTRLDRLGVHFLSQAWQNYVESHFNIARRMSDAKFAKATSWEEVLAIHSKWMRDYNTQRRLRAREP